MTRRDLESDASSAACAIVENDQASGCRASPFQVIYAPAALAHAYAHGLPLAGNNERKGAS